MFFMLCLLLVDSMWLMEYYTLNKDVRQKFTKLHNMQIVLANELVSMLISYCFLRQIFFQGGLFGILVSTFCWDVWSQRCCNRFPPL